MNKEELSTVIALIDAAINKGGIISPDAMYLICNLRAKVIHLTNEIDSKKTNIEKAK